MITVRLQGGLGNQMFQYALGRTIAHRHQTSLAVDVSSYRQDEHREYSLGVFKINVRLDGFPRLDWLRSCGQRLRLPGFAFNLGRVRIPGFSYVLKEKTFAFDPAVVEAPDNVYLDGYWQTEKYFIQAEEAIRGDFRFQTNPTGENAEAAKNILAAQAVSVHVRRGDFIGNPDKIHFALPLDYYRQALGVLASQVPHPHFFVFSDDHGWTRAHLEFPGPATFVTHNGPGQGHEDLRLMALCRHHIIANSTFSWWAAWLSNTPGTIVAPKRWFNLAEMDVCDLVPKGWIRV